MYFPSIIVPFTANAPEVWDSKNDNAPVMAKLAATGALPLYHALGGYTMILQISFVNSTGS
ncbi:hypothetical protein BCM02_106295 [Paenibacillus methanolicus]|uniref:Uncharacterized protein n=1 Tax=Paenibacillus methanolicus TaxID=582686 RepID=A0A5S5C3W1_9BACL|nr:hypothetical protein BCM02_106295 [Paenibacillus methanolicus]